MTLENNLRQFLEEEERNTVGSAFGGNGTDGRRAFSVPKIRDWLLAQPVQSGAVGLESELAQARQLLPPTLLRLTVCNLLRFAFLIELTNLTVGSTKMKTRWLPGLILMPQAGSFEPIRGQFIPGNDPRAASFEDCLGVFRACLNEVVQRFQGDPTIGHQLIVQSTRPSVPYEFAFDYENAFETPVHSANNLAWVFNSDMEWLLRARPIMYQLLSPKLVDKIKTKTYKTDRSLTGKDKTNRAKRWEVLAGDFQHASLSECWSVERRLLHDLASFQGFPESIRQQLAREGLIDANNPPTRCPVTFDILVFDRFGEDPIHGRSEYQVGHLTPLKNGGNHHGFNVRWQSADGNRIQGDLPLETTLALLDGIADRRRAMLENVELMHMT